MCNEDKPKFVVCPRCEGEGKTLSPAFEGQGLDPELASDPEFMEEYSSGMYDVTCKTCHGRRVLDQGQLARYEAERERANSWEAQLWRQIPPRNFQPGLDLPPR